MRKTYKILSVILAVLMIFSIMPITASAETYSGTCGDNLIWTFDKSTGTLIISGIGVMEDYAYPLNVPWFSYRSLIKRAIISDGVTSIGIYAFYYCENLTNITISESVTTIYACAFAYCESLTSVTIPDGVTTIGESAFSCCSNLSSITIGNSVTSIGGQAFAFYKGTSITIPDSVTSIGDEAFYGCEYLTSVILSNSVTNVGDNIFAYCHELKHVAYKGTEEQWNNIALGNDNYELTDAPYLHLNFNQETDITEIMVPSTCQSKGMEGTGCSCGYIYSVTYFDKLDHTYEPVVTTPTCEEKGYTTYTCECGDSYVGDYVDVLGHTTATEVEENYVAPTCTENGSKDVVVYCSVCDEEISRETVIIDATGHADNDGDGYCDADNELLDPTINCICNCHKSGITKFFFNFILFFQKLFGSNRECACGIAHY